MESSLGSIQVFVLRFLCELTLKQNPFILLYPICITELYCDSSCSPFSTIHRDLCFYQKFGCSCLLCSFCLSPSAVSNLSKWDSEKMGLSILCVNISKLVLVLILTRYLFFFFSFHFIRRKNFLTWLHSILTRISWCSSFPLWLS